MVRPLKKSGRFAINYISFERIPDHLNLILHGKRNIIPGLVNIDIFFFTVFNFSYFYQEFKKNCYEIIDPLIFTGYYFYRLR
jgi:hypothetical protein